MRILGIESSCDETAVAIVEDGCRVLASHVLSQIDVHALFGGVVPEIAAREHLKVIHDLTQTALATTGLTLHQIDGIAVTQGPGLIGALLVGVSYAKGLSYGSGLPLIPVDHIYAHVHGALLGLSEPFGDSYPCLAAVVSGGHTNLYIMKGPTEFELIAHTIDDACGECFDKVAKTLGLKYPGGPEIEKLARTGDPKAVDMPRMVDQKARLLFSYSGLKTHLVNLVNREGANLQGQRLADVCAGFQEEALGQLVRKIETALERFPSLRSVLVAGGVAANQRFRAMMAEKIRIPTYFPQLKYCSDNAAMIAALGYHVYGQAPDPGVFRHDFQWDAYSRQTAVVVSNA